jgi:DNA-binding response OmpR family regulator
VGLGVAQKTAFIVDQDRDFALSIAAALRSDGLKVGISEGDRDPLDEIRAERPDIVLMRAELSGKETGYTLCSRVRNIVF